MDNERNNIYKETWICNNEIFPPQKHKNIAEYIYLRKKNHSKIKFLLIPFISIFITITMYSDNKTYEYKEVVDYIVVEGDSLWDISRRYLGKGYKYIQILVDNENEIDNPDLIYAGDKYKITITHKVKINN